jgi:radical SAM protein with 4Fe4S-binding SPASM domain
LTLDLAKACLEDEREATRRAGVTVLAEDESFEADVLLVKSMADTSDSVWQTARRVLLHRYPWLALEPSSVRPAPESAMTGSYGRAWVRLRQAIRQAVREAEPDFDSLKRLLTIPGTIPDIVEELQACGSAFVPQMATGKCGSVGAPQKRQIHLAPTYRCNLTCSYCYAKGFSKGFPTDMTLKDLTFVLSWAARQGVDGIVLCGGEPTVYSYFPEMLRMAVDRGMKVHLTSNSLYPASLRGHIGAPAIHELVAHYDQQRMGSEPAASELFTDNLASARARGTNLLIRYTLTEQSGRGEWRAAMDLAHRLSIEQINYALAFKGSAGMNTAFQYGDALGVADNRVEILLNELCSDAADRGLRLRLCKPFPLCVLAPESLRRVFLNGGVRSACAVTYDGFTRNLTVNPDLSTYPCTGIAIRGPKITELSSFEDAGRINAAAIGNLILRPYREECRRCVLWYRGFCQGTCLAEHHWMAGQDEKDGSGRN